MAVHPAWRRTGVATALLRRFAGLAATCGARAVQAVVRPDDVVAVRMAEALGAVAAPSPGHAGPGQDRTVLTRSLPPA